MTSNYIIHIGNNIVNKRLKINEYLSKNERRIIEKNTSAFFYILINLIFDVPIERFRLVINRKYVFLKKKKKVDVVFTITKKLIIMNNISVKERFLCFGDGRGADGRSADESDGTCCPTPADYIPPECEAPVTDANVSLFPTWRFRPKTVFLDKTIRKNNPLMNEKKDISHHSIMSSLLTNANGEKLLDSIKSLNNYDEPPVQWTSTSIHCLNLLGNIRSEYKEEVKKKLSSYNSFYFKEIKNKMNPFKTKSSEECYCPRGTPHCDTRKVHISGSENNFCQQRSIILIKKSDNKSGINIFDEFLDIYVLFRLKGGKGGFGANLRNKKKKKKKKKKNILDDASRNIRGNRVLLDTIKQTTENLISKREKEQILLEKLNSAPPLIQELSYDNADELENRGAIPRGEPVGQAPDQRRDQSADHHPHGEDAQMQTTFHRRSNLHDIVYNGIVQEGKQKKDKTKKKIDKDKREKSRNLKSIENMYTCL
ncbi:hypothetical protein C922_03213 [Plasmodium inui San Antonio 1]|uniref:SDE2-like domain-containing protein n=1 Tax=Plasmodium inui San Antonio 1 TaxID=1237626 RepID=W6ZZG1_9APIC|nr:hypothetical protein C922_03213 [Plasmodium inui San Antonio 1]EUD66297.1 hypothetical protein C922_03213 [Plasmodium inui San Antonio 1]